MFNFLYVVLVYKYVEPASAKFSNKILVHWYKSNLAS